MGSSDEQNHNQWFPTPSNYGPPLTYRGIPPSDPLKYRDPTDPLKSRDHPDPLTNRDPLQHKDLIDPLHYRDSIGPLLYDQQLTLIRSLFPYYG